MKRLRNVNHATLIHAKYVKIKQKTAKNAKKVKLSLIINVLINVLKVIEKMVSSVKNALLMVVKNAVIIKILVITAMITYSN